MSKHLQRAISGLSKKADSTWATGEAELIISNDEGLYNLALELIEQAKRMDSSFGLGPEYKLATYLEDEIKPIFLSMEYFEDAEVENIDWHALAGELLEWEE